MPLETYQSPASTPPPSAMDAEKSPLLAVPEWTREQEIIDNCVRIRKEFGDWSKNDKRDMDDKYRLYENKPAAGIQNTQGPVIPLVYSQVDTAKARYMGSLFSQEKFFDLLPEGKDALRLEAMGINVGEESSVCEDFLNESIYDTQDFFQKADNLYQNLQLENTMIARVKWNEKKYYDYQAKKSEIEGVEQTVEEDLQVKTAGCPDFIPVSIEEMAWDPRCKYNFRRSAWCSQRIMVRDSELYAMQKAGIITNVQKAMLLRSGSGTGASNTNNPADQKDPQQSQAKQVEGKNLPTGGWTNDLIMLDEWWGEISGKKRNEETGEEEYFCEDYHWFIADEKTLLMMEPNDKEFDFLRRPFVFASVNQKKGELNGFGPIDAIKMLVVKIGNVIKAIDSLEWQAYNSPIFYEPTSFLDGKRTILQGMNLVPVMSSKNINRFPVPVDAITILQNRLTFLIGQLREATASNEVMQGIESSGGGDTATEARLLAASAGQRLQYSSNLVIATFWTQMGEAYRQLWLKMGLEGEMTTREAGVDGAPKAVSMEMLAINYKFRPVSAVPQTQKLSRFRQLNELMVNLLAVPPDKLISTEDGKQMMLNFYDFLVNDMLPLIDVRGGQRLFVEAPPLLPIGGQNPEMPGQPPMGGPGSMPMGPTPTPTTLDNPAGGLTDGQ